VVSRPLQNVWSGDRCTKSKQCTYDRPLKSEIVKIDNPDEAEPKVKQSQILTVLRRNELVTA